MYSRIEKYRKLREEINKENRENALKNDDFYCEFVEEKIVGNECILTYQISAALDEALTEHYGTAAYESILAHEFEEYLKELVEAQKKLDTYENDIDTLVKEIENEK